MGVKGIDGSAARKAFQEAFVESMTKGTLYPYPFAELQEEGTGEELFRCINQRMSKCRKSVERWWLSITSRPAHLDSPSRFHY